MKSLIKRIVLKVGRPMWRRIGPRFYSRVDTRVDMRLAQLDAGWSQHVPAFLNAVSSVKAFGQELAQTQKDLAQTQSELEQSKHEAAATSQELAQTQQALADVRAALSETHESVGRAWERIEFVRREIMYEMKYNAQTHASSRSTGEASADITSMVSEPRILNPEKLAAAERTGLRLNIGCGHIPLDGYINVDMRDLPGVDVLAEAGSLPFEPGSIKEIFSAHVLEHFPQEQLTRRLLPYWRSLLASGGQFRAVTPDGAAMLAGASDGSYSFEEFREVLFGAQEYTGDFHYNMFTPDSLRHILEDAGFTEIQVPVAGRRNGKCFEFEISAVK